MTTQTLATAAPATGSPVNGLAINVQKVVKQFGERPVLRGIDLAVEPGQFLVIVGRSGCGKSTLLRLLAGLDVATKGSIALDRHAPVLASEDVRIMYQDARLLPWQSVVDNVALGLPGSKTARRAVALEALAHVGLADRAHEWPGVLSGGQRQRVALARALVHRPRLLLLDEPLGALDALTRIEMQQLIEDLWQEHRFTAVLVTHDVSEAIALGDRVVLIEQGEIALDVGISLSRPRRRGDASYGVLEEQVLSHLLQEKRAVVTPLPKREKEPWELSHVA